MTDHNFLTRFRARLAELRQDLLPHQALELEDAVLPPAGMRDLVMKFICSDGYSEELEHLYAITVQ